MSNKMPEKAFQNKFRRKSFLLFFRNASYFSCDFHRVFRKKLRFPFPRKTKIIHAHLRVKTTIMIKCLEHLFPGAKRGRKTEKFLERTLAENR